MAKLARMVAAWLVVASLLLGAAASASRRYAPIVFVALLGSLLALLGCAPERPPRPPSGEVIVAAGDIGDCRREGDEATARLVGDISDSTVLTLGDTAYPEGAAEDFEECYEPTWGRFKDRTKPIPGNHEYDTRGAGILRLLRQGRRRPRGGLLLLRPRPVAHSRPQQQLRGGARRLRAFLCAGEVARGGPRRQRGQKLHAGLHASSALQLRGKARQHPLCEAAVGRPVQGGGRRGPLRPRAQLRTLRPAEP